MKDIQRERNPAEKDGRSPTWKKSSVKEILENPQDVINAFNTFYHEEKYRYLDVLFEKGLSYDLGVMVFSMFDFKPAFLIEFVNQ